ncbi:MAG: hypothetical protein LBD23_04240, partial [Oscillospiraceae bacterium]|nr:hypothetical protein [Oscillospiraceae bacterium]
MKKQLFITLKYVITFLLVLLLIISQMPVPLSQAQSTAADLSDEAAFEAELNRLRELFSEIMAEEATGLDTIEINTRSIPHNPPIITDPEPAGKLESFETTKSVRQATVENSPSSGPFTIGQTRIF